MVLHLLESKRETHTVKPKMTGTRGAGKAFHFDKMPTTKHPTLFHIECRQLSF